jgi:hypothetical protein
MQDQQPDSQNIGLIAGLTDFGFNRFITLSVMKVLYMLGIALIGLMWLGGVITFFSLGVGMGLAGLVGVTIAAMVYLIFFRVWMELIVVLFRIGDNTSKLVQATQQKPPA